MNLQQSFQSAAALYNQKRYQEAEALSLEVLAQAPDLIDNIHLLALISKNLDKAKEAENYFRRCLEIDSTREDILSNLGNLYRAEGLDPQARTCFENALEINPRFRPARLALARLCNANEEYAFAIDHAQRLLSENRIDHEALVVLGNGLRGQQQLEKAENAYLQALQLKPDYGAASHNLGALYVQTNRIPDALNKLEHAISCGVRSTTLKLNYATALMSQGDFDKAEALLVDTISAGVTDTQLIDLLTKLRFMSGDKQFTSTYEDCIAKEPENTALRISLATLLQGAEKFDMAEQFLNDYLVTYGQDAGIHYALAASQTLSGKYDAALDNIQSAELLDGNDHRSLPLKIDALMCLGRADEVKPLVLVGRKRFPEDQWYIAMEATAARLLGESRYHELYNYDEFVQEHYLEAPDGWSSTEEFNRDLLSVLKQKHRFTAHPLDQSLRYGTQTPTSLIWDSDPLIQAFLRGIEKPIADYRSSLRKDDGHPLLSRNRGTAKLKGCWSVCLRQHGFHLNHVHPEGWLSSAYYAETPDEIETTTDHAGWLQFGKPRFDVPGTAAERFVKPEPGKLALFPSYMWHGTLPIKNDDPRITIAFDVVTLAD